MKSLLLILSLGFLFVDAKSQVAFSGNSNPSQSENGFEFKQRTFPDTVFEGIPYVSPAILESVFGQRGVWIPDRQKYRIVDGTGAAWFFTLDNPFLIIDDEPYNLIYPVRRGPEKLFIPVPALVSVLNHRLGHTLRYDFDFSAPAIISKTTSTQGPNLTSLQFEVRDNGTLLHIGAPEALAFQQFWVPPHFILRFQHGRTAPAVLGEKSGQGLVKKTIGIQEKNLAQVTLEIPGAIDTVQAQYDTQAKAYRITVRAPKAKAVKVSNPSPTPAATGTGHVHGAKRAIRTIIIDPGHGGRDPGAVYKDGKEAEITLAVGIELKKSLEKAGYKAILTRTDDRYLTLDERPKFASSQGGDLFISLHCNAIDGTPQRKKSVNGFVVYILREGESEEDKALARRENQVLNGEGGVRSKSDISPVEWILLEHQLNLYSKESEGFAEKIVDAFQNFKIKKYSTGARQAGFYVLVGAYMPAVLFEMGFMTNDHDRRVMQSKAGQKEIADRLTQAIIAYDKN